MQPCMMADLPILHFRNPCHYGFLEMYHLHRFIAFCAFSGSIYLDMCVNKVLENLEHTYFKAM